MCWKFNLEKRVGGDIWRREWGRRHLLLSDVPNILHLILSWIYSYYILENISRKISLWALKRQCHEIFDNFFVSHCVCKCAWSESALHHLAQCRLLNKHVYCIGTQSTIWLFDIPKITPPHFWKEIEKSIMFFFFSQKCITQPWVLTAQNMPSPSLFYFKGNI